MPTREAIRTNRRVSNLTDAEVQKKRAIDRVNQRHFRAKTKAYVRSLEEKITELTCRLQECQNELHEYQKRDSDGNTSRSRQSSSLSSSLSSSTRYTAPVASAAQDGDASLGYDTHGSTTAMLSSYRGELDFSTTSALDALPLEFGTGITVNLFNSAQEFSFLDLGLPTDSMSSTQIRESVTPDESPFAGATGPWSPLTTMHTNIAAEWEMVPLNVPATTKLDEFILTTVEAWKERASRCGHQDAEINEPLFPSISSLLNQPREEERPRQLSAAVAAQVCRSPLQSLVERLSFMYNLSYLIRWLVSRTTHSYDKLPDFMKPTRLQCTVPHPAWIDMVVWPEARDQIIQGQMHWDQFAAFRELTGASMWVRWPHADSGSFMESDDGQSLLLNPIFESHIRRIENWQVGEEVAVAFPFMKPFCRPGGPPVRVED